MSAVDDAKTVIEKLVGELPDNAKLIRIADAFVVFAGARFAPADPQNPTNEEKAQNFLNEYRRFGRRILRQVAMDAAQVQANTDIREAGETAAGDL